MTHTITREIRAITTGPIGQSTMELIPSGETCILMYEMPGKGWLVMTMFGTVIVPADALDPTPRKVGKQK